MESKELNTYYKYWRALKGLIAQNGSEMLSADQMKQFIAQHDLFNRYGITTKEVFADATEIIGQISVLERAEYRAALMDELLPKAMEGLSDKEIYNFINSHNYWVKYKLGVEDIRNHIADLYDGFWVPLVSSHSNLFLTNTAYKSALTNHVKSVGEAALGEYSIRAFIKRSGFDKSCGLDVATVKQDIYALPNKFNVQVLKTAVPRNIVKEERPAVIEEKPLTKSHGAKATSINIDYDLVSAITAVLSNHQNAIRDRRLMASLLKDICPNRRRDINILLQAYDLGIMEEIKFQREIDRVFVNRFANAVVNEYGTSESLAQSMVSIWCLCYGRDILQLRCDL